MGEYTVYALENVTFVHTNKRNVRLRRFLSTIIGLNNVGDCLIENSTLCYKLGVSERTLQRDLAFLESEQYIIRDVDKTRDNWRNIALGNRLKHLIKPQTVTNTYVLYKNKNIYNNTCVVLPSDPETIDPNYLIFLCNEKRGETRMAEPHAPIQMTPAFENKSNKFDMKIVKLEDTYINENMKLNKIPMSDYDAFRKQSCLVSNYEAAIAHAKSTKALKLKKLEVNLDLKRLIPEPTSKVELALKEACKKKRESYRDVYSQAFYEMTYGNMKTNIYSGKKTKLDDVLRMATQCVLKEKWFANRFWRRDWIIEHNKIEFSKIKTKAEVYTTVNKCV